jgi:hypothetical protein
MILHLALRNAKQLRQLIGGQARAGQEFDHALARREWYGRHGGILWEAEPNSKLNDFHDFGRMKPGCL